VSRSRRPKCLWKDAASEWTPLPAPPPPFIIDRLRTPLPSFLPTPPSQPPHFARWLRISATEPINESWNGYCTTAVGPRLTVVRVLRCNSRTSLMQRTPALRSCIYIYILIGDVIDGETSLTDIKWRTGIRVKQPASWVVRLHVGGPTPRVCREIATRSLTQDDNSTLLSVVSAAEDAASRDRLR
jgi:hypothetical protein